MAKFKVVSDGTRTGTKIYAPDGTEISDLVRRYDISLSHEAGDIPKLVLEIIRPEVEIVAEADGLDLVDGQLVKEVAAGTWSEPDAVVQVPING